MKDETEAAFVRARGHLRRSTLEGLEAARALIQAAILSSGVTSASRDSIVGGLQRGLEELIAGFRENATFVFPSALGEPLAEALETEINRWEKRSQTDPDARPVLRAFLGLRELLWELGLRRDEPPRNTPPGPSNQRDRPPATKRDRVQRFKIDD